jgi:hypothetical protein
MNERVVERFRHVLCNVAVFSIFLRPMIVAISMSASTSSLDWSNGNLPVRKKRSIIPVDHTSIAVRKQAKSLCEGKQKVKLNPTSRLLVTFQ